nr:PREDICTED: uncharacterized protein LOC103281050 [Anolis carolinensis]|eukprot:XP_008119927.1 PREDICTED: uncharacterized protein LOC103281050 [Anolis carolinensis]
MEVASRYLMLALVALCISSSGQVQALTSCPNCDDFSVPEGSSKVIAANVSAYPKMLVLHKNNSPISLEKILFINKGQIQFVETAWTDYFYMSGNDLAIKNANEVLTGCYQLAYQLNELSVKQFCLAILGPWNCSSDSFSLAEGSSEKIIANKSTNSFDLALYKKVNVSSDWEHILNITDGHLSYIREEYKNNFLLSEDGLTLKNATKGLTGEYQLVGEGNKTCVQQFFLNVTGSGATRDSTSSAIPIGIFILVVILALCVGSFIYRKKKRREENRNEFAHHSTKVQDSENGFLQHGTEATEMQGTEMDKHRRYNRDLSPKNEEVPHSHCAE